MSLAESGQRRVEQKTWGLTAVIHQPMKTADLKFNEFRMLAEASGVDEDRVRELAELGDRTGQSLFRVLLEREAVDESELLDRLAGGLGVGVWAEPAEAIPPHVIQRVPASLATRYEVFPVAVDDGCLILATHDPFEWRRWDELAHLINTPIRRALAPRNTITGLIKTHYGLGADTVERLMEGRGDQELQIADAGTDLSGEEAANEPTVVNLVNKILSEAIIANATDIHFEPYDSKYRVRYRIDGMLEEVSIPVSVKFLKSAVVSRLKIMSHLDITEKRLPQDGRARVTLGNSEYDLRVSILPGVYGEAINIRLQSRQMVKLELSGLGFQPPEQTKIASLIERPHGLVLVTGPTGSGKTTTLYTCLSRINKPETKIITIEDPVEYWMDDILQMQAHEEIGFDFSRALRSMLRHDPDVMLIGEIRDRDTADITIRSALTGHLVFATLHTNDAAGAVSRLLDIGIEPFLAASSLSGIVAQRLVRRVCTECKELVTTEGLADLTQSWVGRGCSACRHSGYRGRTIIAEVLPVTAAIRELIQDRAPADRIKDEARREGMQTLYDSAVQAVRDGRTTLAEAMRITQEDL